PFGLVPTLELDDGTYLVESMAICRYFDELHPSPNLFGEGALEKARVEQWSRLAELELLFPVAHVFRNTHAFWRGRIPQVPEFGQVALDQLRERLAFFDRELDARRYVAGDRFTVADITAFVAIDFARIIGVRPEESQSALKRWYGEIGARPS